MKLTESLPQDPNTIHSAHETRFNPAHYSDALTAFTTAWKDDEAIEPLLNFIAPVVPVSRRFEYKQCETDQLFFSEQDDLRAPGSSFKRVEFTGKTIQAKTLNKGLTVRVDSDDVLGNDWQESYVHLLMKRLYRNELRRAIAALKANSNEVKKTWNEESQPDNDIREVLLLTANDSGFYPNRLLFGELAWFKRMDCYCTQDNAGARIAAELTRENLAEKLLVEEVRLLKKQFLGLQGNESEGHEIYAFYAKNGLLKDEPSHIKRFVTPVENGHAFRVYLEEHSKYTDITVEHYSNLVVTSAKGITKLLLS